MTGSRTGVEEHGMKRACDDRRFEAALGSRSGAAAVEGAIVMSALIVVLFGMLDLSLVVLESNTLSEATRRLGRQAVVHGQMATAPMTVWGPTSVAGSAGDGTEFAQALRPELATFDLNQVKYSIDWPDGTNRPDDRVRVKVTYQYQPLMPFVLGSGSVPLQAVTTMQVAH